MPRPAGGAAAETYIPMTIPVDLAALAVASTIVYNFALGFRFRLAAVRASAYQVGVGAGATRAVSVQKVIGANITTIATTTITLASTDTMGEVQAFGPVAPGNDVFEDGDILRVFASAGGTAFTAGKVLLTVTLAVQGQGKG